MELIKEEFPDLKFGYFNPPWKESKEILKWILRTDVFSQKLREGREYNLRFELSVLCVKIIPLLTFPQAAIRQSKTNLQR